MKFRSRLKVDLKKIKHNCAEIRKISGNKEILFMVKADAYGHGMIPVARFLYEEASVREFGCATLFEASELREQLADLNFDIFVFSDVHLEEENALEHYLKKRLIPVISDLDFLEKILSSPESRHLPISLKFNTGMNRLGIAEEYTISAIKLLKKFQRTEVHHLFTHFANASKAFHLDEQCLNQYDRFLKIKKIFLDAGIHVQNFSCANSGALTQKIGLDECTHVRPGLSMFGLSSLDEEVNCEDYHGQVVSELQTHILKVFPVKKGMTVGYNSTPVLEDGVIAILGIGYGDGFFNRYSGATVTHKGHRGFIFGRVSMDMTHVFFPNSAKNDIKAFDCVSLWGQSEGDFLNFSKECKIIPYEIFCALLPRVPRHYIDERL